LNLDILNKRKTLETAGRKENGIRHNRIYSGAGLRKLGLVELVSALKSPQERISASTSKMADRYYSEQDLFEEGVAGPSGSYPPGVPKGAQPLPGMSKEPVQPRATDFFNSVLKDVSTTQLHKLITSNMNKFDFATYVDNIKYQGFNREEYIRSTLERITVSQALRLALMGAIRGSRFDKVNSSGTVDVDLVVLFTGQNPIVVKSATKAKDITILRCTASVPQWCSYYMMTARVVKKVPNLACPAWLQFPAAAAIPMSSQLRTQHIEFCIQFSKMINGVFNANIYMAMFNNQVPWVEVPDSLRTVLGISSMAESTSVDISPVMVNLTNVSQRQAITQ
jgi:hypothetical protein